MISKTIHDSIQTMLRLETPANSEPAALGSAWKSLEGVALGCAWKRSGGRTRLRLEEVGWSHSVVSRVCRFSTLGDACKPKVGDAWQCLVFSRAGEVPKVSPLAASSGCHEPCKRAAPPLPSWHPAPLQVPPLFLCDVRCRCRRRRKSARGRGFVDVFLACVSIIQYRPCEICGRVCGRASKKTRGAVAAGFGWTPRLPRGF